MHCIKCGNELSNDDLFCNKCGAKIQSQAKDIKTDKKKIPKWLDVILTIIITIAVFACVGKLSDYLDKKHTERVADKYFLEHPEDKYVQLNSTSDNSNRYEELNDNLKFNLDSLTAIRVMGNHKLIYFDGIDISGINGYLIINDDETFKIYANYTVANMELINIEGTYTISNDKIKIKITKEGGYDLGSQSRDDIITIANDNLAYSGYKFAR